MSWDDGDVQISRVWVKHHVNVRVGFYEIFGCLSIIQWGWHPVLVMKGVYLIEKFMNQIISNTLYMLLVNVVDEAM